MPTIPSNTNPIPKIRPDNFLHNKLFCFPSPEFLHDKPYINKADDVNNKILKPIANIPTDEKTKGKIVNNKPIPKSEIPIIKRTFLYMPS